MPAVPFSPPVLQVSVVTQEPVIFSRSIRDNIAYGLPDCSLDDVQQAAKKANAHNFISQLEKGYDTGSFDGTSRCWGEALRPQANPLVVPQRWAREEDCPRARSRGLP